jgi:hypothetical protein
MVGGIKLADIDRAFGTVEQLDPHRARLAQIGASQFGVQRHGVYQFKPRN